MDITIIIPLYKGMKYCKRLLEQIERNYKYHALYKECNVEVIFVNDYPEEQIELNDLEYEFRIRLIIQKENKGIHASRIEGIKNAAGQYILLLDQDDLIEDNHLYSQWKKIKKQAGDYCVCNGWSDRFKILWQLHTFEGRVNNILYYLERGNAIISPGQVLIRKEAIPNEWMNNIQKCNGADDFLLWVLALKKGWNFIINNEPLYFHNPNRSADSVSDEKMIDSLLETYQILNHLSILSMEEENLLLRQIEERLYLIGKQKDSNQQENNIINLNTYRKHTDIFHTYDLWLKLRNNGITISDYLKKEDISRIAIYGLGSLGQNLYGELIREGIEVAYGIDCVAIDHEHQLQVFHIDDNLEKVDLIIITVIGIDKGLSDVIQQHIGCQSKTLTEILIDMSIMLEENKLY